MAGHLKWSNVQRRNDALDSNRGTLVRKLAHGTPRATTALDTSLGCGPRVFGSGRVLCALEIGAGDRSVSFGIEQQTDSNVILDAGCAASSKNSLHVQRKMAGDSVGKAGLHADLFQLICLLNYPLSFADKTASICDPRVPPAFAERNVTSQLFSQS